MIRILKELYRAENFWQTVLCAMSAAGVYASGSFYASGVISAISVFFLCDCIAERWPKYFKRIGAGAP